MKRLLLVALLAVACAHAPAPKAAPSVDDSEDSPQWLRCRARCHDLGMPPGYYLEDDDGWHCVCSVPQAPPEPIRA